MQKGERKPAHTVNQRLLNSYTTLHNITQGPQTRELEAFSGRSRTILPPWRKFGKFSLITIPRFGAVKGASG